MTRMFKLALARELTKLADTPDLIAMPSLTIASMRTSVRHIEFTSERESSSSNADLRERLSAMVDTEQHVKKYNMARVCWTLYNCTLDTVDLPARE